MNNDNPSVITLPLILRNKVGVFGKEYPQNALDDEIPLLKVNTMQSMISLPLLTSSIGASVQSGCNGVVGA